MFDRTKLISLDLETGGRENLYGLQPWRLNQGDGWINSYAMAWYDNDGNIQRAVKKRPSKRDMHEMLERVVASGRRCLLWNAGFDIAWLCADGHFPQVWKIDWIDAMLLWRHLMVEPEYDANRAQKRSYSLESAVNTFFPGEAGFKENETFDPQTEQEWRSLLVRNVGDAEYTLKLGAMFLDELSVTPRRLVPALIEAKCLGMVGRVNCWGMQVNTPYTRTLNNALSIKADELLAELGPMGVTAEVVRSPKQLAKVLYEDWGLPSQGVTESGQLSTSKEALYELALLDPRAKRVKEYRETLNNQSKFAQSVLNAVDYNREDRVHPSMRVFGTYTGRMTVNSKVGKNKDERTISSALHQTKRGVDYRKCMEAPDGYTVVEFDARTQEYRWMAIVSGDETMLELCHDGEDAHAYMGSSVIGVDYATMLKVLGDETHISYKEYRTGRQLGKVANLSAQYRTSPGKIRVVSQVQYDVPMSEYMSKQVWTMYRRTYSRVPKYWERTIGDGYINGYVETLAGRRVQLVDPWDKAHKWMLESTCINYPVQGTGADQKYLALACMKPVVTKHNAFFWFEMHDGAYFIVPNARVPQFVADGKRVLDHLPYQQAWGFTPPVPMPWDVKTGPNWGELKEYHE